MERRGGEERREEERRGEGAKGEGSTCFTQHEPILKRSRQCNRRPAVFPPKININERYDVAKNPIVGYILTET